MQFNVRFRVSAVQGWLQTPGRVLIVALIVFKTAAAGATILSSNVVIPWVPGVTVGIPGGVIPTRTHLLDVSQSPYNADKTGVLDATKAINSAIAAAKSNDVVYIPTGRYRITAVGGISLNKSYISLRGDGPDKTILMALTNQTPLNIGSSGLSASTNSMYPVVSGATRGSTKLIVQTPANFAVGRMYTLSQTNFYDDRLRVICAGGYDRTMAQQVIVASVSGSTVTITTPLVFDFTNSPAMMAYNYSMQSGVGIEGIAVTCTNTATGESGVVATTVTMRGLADSWMTNCDISCANNYMLVLSGCVHCWINGNRIHKAISTGSNHSGLLTAGITGVLFENNVLSEGLAPAIEFNGAVDGCAFFGNMFTNNYGSVVCHGPHPIMDLWEQNLFYDTWELDGYFGSCSHQTLFRNLFTGGGYSPLKINRFSSFINIVGNVLGTPSSPYGPWTYSCTNKGGQLPAIITFGYPNIGNYDYYQVSATNVAWNFPGTVYENPGFGTPFKSAVWLTNGIYTFTNNQGPTNVLYGNFTNLISGSLGYLAQICFQDNINTNIYHTDGLNGLSVVSITSSNMTISKPFTVHTGWTVYCIGSGSFQNYSTSDVLTDVVHGNYDFANKAVMWSPEISDHSIPTSILYPSGPPAWWSGNWPAIDPANPNVPPDAIPAGYRYLHVTGSAQANRPYPPMALHVIGTAIQ